MIERNINREILKHVHTYFLVKSIRACHWRNERVSFSEWNTCLACSKSYKWRKSLHRHVRESPECWPVLLTSGNGEFIRQIHYKMLYNVNNWFASYTIQALDICNCYDLTKSMHPRTMFLRDHFSCYCGYLFIEINVILYSDTKGQCVTIISTLSVAAHQKQLVYCSAVKTIFDSLFRLLHTEMSHLFPSIHLHQANQFI